MTKLNLFYCIALLFCCVSISSQQISFEGPVSIAMGHTKLFDDTSWSVLNNVAGISDSETLSFGASYGLPYGIAELSYRAANLILPTTHGVFSGVFSQSGYSKSQFTGMTLGYCRLFGKTVSASLQLNYLRHQIGASHSASSFYSRAGLLVKANKVLQLGLMIQNMEQNTISYRGYDVDIPTLFCTALRWKFEQVRLIAEVEKQLSYDPFYKTGLEVNLKEILYVRGGVAGELVVFTFGAGVQFEQFTIDTGFSHHQVLGLSSSIGISYKLIKKAKQP